VKGATKIFKKWLDLVAVTQDALAADVKLAKN